MNYRGIYSLYYFELKRFFRTIIQSILSPILTTSLYFLVFGSAIGSRISNINGIDYGSFILPGLVMLTILSNSLSNASFSIFFKKFNQTIGELFVAPLSSFEIVIAFVGASATKSMIIGLIIISTSMFFIDLEISHPLLMLFFLLLISITFSLFGLIIGIFADNFERLSLIPILLLTPLSFLGGVFYSIDMLPDIWRNVSLLNPILYLISGFRWSFYEISDVSLLTSLITILTFLTLCILFITYIFKTGYKLKN